MNRRFVLALFAVAMGCPVAAAGEAGSKPVMPRLQVIKQVEPEYPVAMRYNRLEGVVVVEFTIDVLGRVRDPFIVRSNNAWFERPALQALSQWQFQPVLRDGVPVEVPHVMQEIRFQIRGGGHSAWEIRKGNGHDQLEDALRWDVAPEPTNTAFPVFPFELLQAGAKGRTRINFIVDPRGRVARADVVEASSPELGLATLAMIDTWRFKPARKANGKPCFAAVSMQHEFSRSDRSNVPVSDEAWYILRLLKRHPERIVAPADLDQPIKPVSRRPPVFPLALLQQEKPGEAEIECFIGRDGDAQLPRIVSCTVPEFGYAGVQAIATWRFEPPLKGGKPVVTKVRIPLKFSLKP